MQRDYIVFGAPIIDDSNIQSVVDTLKSGWIGTGPKSHLFEQKIAQYKSVSHAIAVNSCTAALHLSLIALQLQPGDEVITSSMTFCATVNAIIHSGATPVLVDCDPYTFNITADAIASKITPKTKAIIPIHFAGYPCDMDSIMALAKAHNLYVVEDCAHALETTYNGQPVGSFGDFGCLSFYVTKNLCTGEGGMVLTSNEDMSSRIKKVSLHGMSKDAWNRFGDDGYCHYQVIEPGFKYNMTDMAAALGLSQLDTISINHDRRRLIFKHYLDAFAHLPIQLPSLPPSEHRHGFHLFTIVLDPERVSISRDELIQTLHEQGIGTGVHYMGIHLHPYYQQTYSLKPSDFPHANYISQNTLSIPLSPKLSDEDVSYICDTVSNIFKPTS